MWQKNLNTENQHQLELPGPFCYTTQNIRLLIELLCSLNTFKFLIADRHFNQSDFSIKIKFSKRLKENFLGRITEKTRTVEKN